MESLLVELGVNWRILLAQGVNFFALLAILTVLLYRPLLKLLDERREKIALGVRAGEEAERRLAVIGEEERRRLAQAEREALGIIGSAEEAAERRSAEIVAGAEAKAASALAEAKLVTEQRRAEELARLGEEAGAIVRDAIAKAVALDPADIDEALIERAAAIIRARESG